MGSFVSPQLDNIMECYGSNQMLESSSPEYLAMVLDTLSAVQQIEPVMDGNTRSWELWLRTERGRIEDFADYEELLEYGEISSRKELVQWWLDEYPDEMQWRRAVVRWWDDQVFFSCGKLQLGVDLSSSCFTEIDMEQGIAQDLVTWLMEGIKLEVECFVEDPEGYKRQVQHCLPLKNRWGRLRRLDLWNASPEICRHDRELGAESIERFRQLVPYVQDDVSTLDQVSLADFLGYCRLCYLANGYDRIQPGMTQREMYRAMADNREEGMLDITDDESPVAFRTWYENRSFSGHPWEICRGGNRTHISLQAVLDGDGWRLYLHGFSDARVLETARMAIALYEAGVPFLLVHAEEMLRMLSGEDYLGIVPDAVSLGYNHEDFPKKDRIYSFVYLRAIEEIAPSQVSRIDWYPLPEMRPAVSSA